MFFPEPERAFANLRRALKSDGRTCFAVWQAPEKNSWITLALRPLSELPRPEPPAPGTPGPFSMADADYTTELLRAAGYADVELESVEHPLEVGQTPEELVDFFGRVGPLSRHLAMLPEEARPAVRERVRRYLEDEWDSLRFEAAYWLVHARA